MTYLHSFRTETVDPFFAECLIEQGVLTLLSREAKGRFNHGLTFSASGWRDTDSDDAYHDPQQKNRRWCAHCSLYIDSDLDLVINKNECYVG